METLHSSGHKLGIPSGRCINRLRGSPNTVFYFIRFYFIFLFIHLFILPSGGGSVPFVHPRKYAPGKGLLWNRSQNGCHRSLMAFTAAKRAPLMAAFKRGNREKPAGARSGSKDGDQAQLPSSEPGIGAHGSHCVQEHYRGTASIFQSCATLTEPAGYAVAIGLILPGKLRH